MIRCLDEVESVIIDDVYWIKVNTKDGLSWKIAPSDISLILKLEWNERQKDLWEIMEHLPRKYMAKLMRMYPEDVKRALEDYILYKRIDNCY